MGINPRVTKAFRAPTSCQRGGGADDPPPLLPETYLKQNDIFDGCSVYNSRIFLHLTIKNIYRGAT